MVKKRSLSPQPLLDQTRLPEFLRAEGFKELHATTIWRYLAQHPEEKNLDKVPNLPHKLKKRLAEEFTVSSLSLITKQESSDGTIKLLLRLQDGHEVEAVIMKHTGRHTLCVSSQVGCQMGCTFCATGTMGIIADLCSGEILEQLAAAFRFAPIRNVVFMGMGEPLNNYDAVLDAIRGMTSVFGIAPRHITLSTVGVIHRIRQLNKDAPLVRLALSLHAPTQTLRSEIVPTSTAYPLDKLMTVVDEHLAQKENRMVMVEYCMLEGVNDSIETAHDLGKLLQNRSVHVNLIPYNATEVDAAYNAPSREAIQAFHSVLRNPYNLKVTIRENHGMDIDGACGQLALKNKNKKTEDGDIEDIGRSSAVKKNKKPAVLEVQGVMARALQLFEKHQTLVGCSLIAAAISVFATGYLKKNKVMS